jgi:hypothetical protein
MLLCRETTGRRQPEKKTLPKDPFKLKRIVASVINRDHDALKNTCKYGHIERWNTSGVTSMKSLFFGVSPSAPEQTLDLSRWDTSNVTSMQAMLAGLPARVTVTGFGSWDTSNVEDMSAMFYNAKGMTLAPDSADYESMKRWNTSKVNSMRDMFLLTGDKDEYITGTRIHRIADVLARVWDTSSLSAINACNGRWYASYIKRP